MTGRRRLPALCIKTKQPSGSIRANAIFELGGEILLTSPNTKRDTALHIESKPLAFERDPLAPSTVKAVRLLPARRVLRGARAQQLSSEQTAARKTNNAHQGRMGLTYFGGFSIIAMENAGVRSVRRPISCPLNGGVKNCDDGKIPKRTRTKAKLNLTVREEQRNKLEQMASLENRSVSNLIEVMADEHWKRLAEQEGVEAISKPNSPQERPMT